MLEKDKQILKERYQKLYGGKDCTEKIKKDQKEWKKQCCIILLLFVLISGVMILENVGDTGLIKRKDGSLIAVERPSGKESAVIFNAQVNAKSKNGEVKKDVQITVEPVGTEEKKEESEAITAKESDEERISREINQIIRGLNSPAVSKRVNLPDKLQTGEKLKWKQADTSNVPILFIGFFFLIAIVYRSRFRTVLAEERKARESIVRELPEFMNKLVLLLNAGAVINLAFTKIMEEREFFVPGKDTYFYQQLADIHKRIKETNCSMDKEFRAFAKRSGVRELMRVSNIIQNNIGKGSDLIGKLQTESELLWFARKQQSEEKGRVAETKLTMPLVILLLVLVMVTIAPALMEI